MAKLTCKKHNRILIGKKECVDCEGEEKSCKHSWTEWEGKWSCQLYGKPMTKLTKNV